MKSLHLLRAGKHTDGKGQVFELADADIAAIAASYDPAKHEAPIVIGHPASNAPAWGWIASLQSDEHGLHAEADQIDASFAEAVRAGKYKKISVAMYGPTHPNNPTPGNWALRHVGFLGAQPPVVKGLRSVELAEGDEPTLVTEIDLAEDQVQPWVFFNIASTFRRWRDWLIETQSLDAADKIIPERQIGNIEQEAARLAAERNKETTNFSETPSEIETMKANDKAVELAEQETALKQREDELAAKEARIAAEETTRATREAAEFAERLVVEGRVLPRDKAALASILTLLPDDAEVEFAEGDADPKPGPAGTYLRQFLAGLPVQVDYSERAPGDGETKVLKFTVVEGQEVSAESLDLHRKVITFSEANKVTYDEALQRVATH